ncbi:MAG TPA: YitT family protein [Ignavibacteriales bacterium]|nr:YitT family protein [Ignavibacteriales bacterium]
MEKTSATIKSYLIIALGLFVYALGWAAFLIPSKIVGGGLSGLCTSIYFVTGIPVGVTFLVLNSVLIVLSIKILGRGFGIKTVYAVLILSFFLSLLQYYIHEPVVKDAFMASILGGILGGVGIGMVFTQGGSSGGTDIIAMIIIKYKNLSPGKILLALDVVIISSSYLIFHSLEKIVYGCVVMAVTTYTIDMLLEGAKQSMQVFVFSDKNEVIAERIGRELRRGITFLKGKGWYTNEEKEVLMVVARKNELGFLLRIVKEADEEAFLSYNSVMGVFGKGFEKIRY